MCSEKNCRVSGKHREHRNSLGQTWGTDSKGVCICPGDIPVCPGCGRRWEFVRMWSDGSATYTSAEVVAKYHALYGEPEVPFLLVGAKEVA